MNYSFLGFFSVFLSVSLFFEFSECRSVQKNTSNALKKLFECLDNTLSNDSKKCDENIAYGVNVAAGQLRSILKFLETNSNLFMKVQEIEKLAVKVLEKMKINCKSTLFHTSLTSAIWESNMNPQTMFSTSRDFEIFYRREVSKISSLSEVELLQHGHPNESESNNCLMMLNKNCVIDRECLEEETESGNSGYSLTHQIIYWQNFRQMKCSKEYDGLIKKIIREKCSRVYAQQIYITRHYSFDDNILDLFTEQVAVCGMEGFEEFLKDENRKIIINNQMTCGCYRFLGDGSVAEAHQLSCMYDAHLTSVAALALTIQLKYEVLF